MCTAASYLHRYFGRNLDLAFTYRESVVVMPRRFPLRFRAGVSWASHYAMVGMATVADGYPLFYEATNEKGLSIAGLNFPGYAAAWPYREGMDNVAVFELIPWLLGQFETVAQVRRAIPRLNLWDERFSPELPNATLHYLISDATESITLEPVREGLRVYDNPVGVLSNNPPFDYQMLHLADFMGLSPEHPENRFSSRLELSPYCLGMGAMGLPGDLSSASRFVRAAFANLNAVPGGTEEENVTQFFHILNTVAQTKGLARADEGKFEYTVYSSCCDAKTGVYYYTTYQNSQLTAVDMHRENLDGAALAVYPMVKSQQIRREN